jgi:hypothetical protein
MELQIQISDVACFFDCKSEKSFSILRLVKASFTKTNHQPDVEFTLDSTNGESVVVSLSSPKLSQNGGDLLLTAQTESIKLIEFNALNTASATLFMTILRCC